MTDLVLDDGRTLRVHDTGPADAPLTVLWHHGTPNTGEPPVPLLGDGVRWVGLDRPGYGGSTSRPGRDVAAVAGDVAQVVDALGIGRFVTAGHSGGAPHALACGALMADRVTGVVCVAAIAPRDAAGLDWFAGMGPAGTAELRAAETGRDVLAALLAATEFDPEQFTAADHAALDGPWGWLATVAAQGLANGPDGMLDDDVAYVSPWGFDPAQVAAPVVLLHGDDDRIAPPAHAVWLARRCPDAELWRRPGEGHISVLGSAARALDALRRP